MTIGLLLRKRFLLQNAESTGVQWHLNQLRPYAYHASVGKLSAQFFFVYRARENSLVQHLSLKLLQTALHEVACGFWEHPACTAPFVSEVLTCSVFYAVNTARHMSSNRSCVAYAYVHCPSEYVFIVRDSRAELGIIKPAAACDCNPRQRRYISVGAAYRLAAAFRPMLANEALSLGYEIDCFVQELNDERRQTQETVQPIHRQITSSQGRRRCRPAGLIPLTCLYFTSLKLQQQTYVRIFMKVEKRRRNLPASGESLCVETQIKLNTGQRFNWVKAIALEPVAYAGGNPPALDSPLTRDDHFPYITCQGSESITQKHSSAPYLANASTYAAYGKAA